MPGTKVDSKQRITVRNLRIREDTAKYLRNLDPNSAYYDPKTRSMRDNPHSMAGTGEQEYVTKEFFNLSPFQNIFTIVLQLFIYNQSSIVNWSLFQFVVCLL